MAAIGVLRLKADYLDSPSLEKCSLQARSHWHRIVLATADAYGCFKVNPIEIHATAFPSGRWPYKPRQVMAWLDEYEAHGMLARWEEDGRVYGFWTGWPHHNRIDTRYKRQTPEPPETLVAQRSAEMRKDAGRFPVPIPNPVPNPNPKEYSPEFLAFWKEYPRQVSKPDAARAWRRQKPDLDVALKGLSRWKAQWDDPQYIPYPANFLNRRQWEDAPKVDLKPKIEYYDAAEQRRRWERGED